MNKATRSILAVLLALALTGGLTLADDATGLYEKLFGAEAKKVAASSTKADDVALAAKLLKAAKMRPDLPDLQIVLYEKAFQFGTAGTDGCDAALEALVLLRKVLDARQADALLQKKVSAHDLQAMQKDLDTAKSKRVKAMGAQETKRKELQDRLQANPKDKQSRKELILLYIVVFDNPEKAAKLVTDDTDKTTRTYISLATRKLTKLDRTACLKLGDWYYKDLAKNVSGALRPALLRRAKRYYRRGLALPTTTKDGRLARDRVWAILLRIEKELKDPAARTTPAARTKGPENTKGNDNPPATARVVAFQGLTITLSNDGKTLTAADNLTGKLLWRCRMGKAATGISLDRRAIKVSPGGELFNVRTGKRLR
ncbi:MAG: hypothetical protein ISS69_14360 [Phycisphaerae bacterium]|nr:hypothetical protein [Phycisphaerae bacterium]